MDIPAFQERLAAGKQPSPFGDHMGMRFVAAETQRGHTVVEVDVGPHLHNPNGVAHGGLLSSLADSAMGTCMFTLLADDETCTNMDLDVRFLRPVRDGTLRATSRVVKEGRTISLLAADVVDEQGRLVATAQSTFVRVGLQQT